MPLPRLRTLFLTFKKWQRSHYFSFLTIASQALRELWLLINYHILAISMHHCICCLEEGCNAKHNMQISQYLWCRFEWKYYEHAVSIKNHYKINIKSLYLVIGFLLSTNSKSVGCMCVCQYDFFFFFFWL